MLPFGKMIGNFFKALFVGVLGTILCAFTMILANQAQNSLDIFLTHFWKTAVMGGITFMVASFFVLSFTHGVQQHRSEKANQFFSTFWGIALFGCLAFCGKLGYDYAVSPHRLGVEWKGVHMQNVQQQQLCGHNCVRYRGNLNYGPAGQ